MVLTRPCVALIRGCVALYVCAWPYACVCEGAGAGGGGGGVPGPVRPCIPSRLGAEVEVQDGRHTQGTPPPTSAKLVDSQALSAALRTPVLSSPIQGYFSSPAGEDSYALSTLSLMAGEGRRQETGSLLVSRRRIQTPGTIGQTII